MATADALFKAVKGEAGTLCLAQPKKLSSRNKWLASGSLIKGMVTVDEGARSALVGRKSLLAVGIKQVNQAFEAGEVFQIANENGEIIAVAKAKVDVNDLASIHSKKNLAIAHVDDIVML